MRDPFTVLGVTDEADDAEIRRRYLALVREILSLPPARPSASRSYGPPMTLSATSEGGWRRRCCTTTPPPWLS